MTMVNNIQCVKGSLFALLCCVCVLVAQHDNLRTLPQAELMPLATAYGLALDHYAAESWTDCIKYMEISLRLHRLLKDSLTYCIRHCNDTSHNQEELVLVTSDLQVFWRVLMRASCHKKCREHFPALSLPYPREEILQDFERRSPYRYMHLAYFKINDLQKAVSCAHTYLQKNPDDQLMKQYMDHYRSQYDLEGFLIDQEEQPYEGSFLKAVTMFNSGDFSSCIKHMEQALSQYLHQHQLCQAACEGGSEVPLLRDLYPTLADTYVEALRCKVKCEENLMPNVGGYFVEKFIATMYHYLQFSYYKLNEARRAAPCASSYILFDPEDEVMRQNIQYYRSYSQQWGLEDRHFTPRLEAQMYYNQNSAQKQMLTSAEMYLQSDGEDFLDPEVIAMVSPESPDVEFEGPGDYEESIYAKWLQPKGKWDTGDSDM